LRTSKTKHPRVEKEKKGKKYIGDVKEPKYTRMGEPTKLGVIG